jgi:hypothetical protein
VNELLYVSLPSLLVNKPVDNLRVSGVEEEFLGVYFDACGELSLLSSGYPQLLWYEKIKISVTLG